MDLKRVFIICTAIGIGSFFMAGVLYRLGGDELLKVQSSYRDGIEDKTIEKEEKIEDIQSIRINISVANINFKYTDEDVLKLELINPLEQSEQPIKIKKDRDTLNIEINDIEKRFNFNIGKGFKNIRECKLNVSIPRKYKGNIDISTDVGNIKGEYAGKELKLSTDVGNIDVEINEIESGKITTDVGHIKLKIKEESNLTLYLKTELGTLKNNLKNIKNLDDNSDTKIKISQDTKFDINEGGSLIRIKSDLGNIELYN